MEKAAVILTDEKGEKLYSPDLESYRQAIANAENALAEAERELDEMLAGE